MRRVLFVTYGGGHVAMLLPVLQQINRRDDLCCFTLALTTAAAVLERQGMPWRGFTSLVRKGDEQALDWGRRLAEDLPAGGLVSAEESIAYLGLSYTDLEDRFGKEEALRLFTEQGRQAFLPLGPMRRLFDEIEPDLVVATISPRAEQAALMIARERGIPSICLVDLFDDPSLERASKSGYGSRVCVLTDGVRHRLLAAGRAPEEVVTTGNPAFDILGCGELADRAHQMRASRGWDREQVILWASQVEPRRHPFSGALGDPNLPSTVENHLLKLIGDHPDWRLVIRPHPSEAKREPMGIDRVEISGQDDELAVLLNAVDVVVTLTSTVGVEARILGKPLVTIDLSVFSKDSQFEATGFSRGVRDLSQLGSVLEQSLRQAGSVGESFTPPGNATQAVLAQIDELLASGANR